MNSVKLRAAVELCRGTNSLALSLLFLAVARAAHAASWAEQLAGSLAWLMTAASAYALNDRIDLAIDRINRPTRPLPSARLTTHEADLIIGATALTALLSALAWHPGILWIAGSLGLSGCYSIWLRHRSAIWSNVLASLLVAGVPLSAFNHLADAFWVLIPLGVFSLILARELQKDVVDARGDKGTRPAAVMLSLDARNADRLFRLLTVAAILCLSAATKVLPLSDASKIVLLSAVVCPLAVSLLLPWPKQLTAALDARLIKLATYSLVVALLL